MLVGTLSMHVSGRSRLHSMKQRTHVINFREKYMGQEGKDQADKDRAEHVEVNPKMNNCL